MFFDILWTVHQDIVA